MPEEIPSLDIQVQPVMNSWSSIPAGVGLLIEEDPDYFLLIDDSGHKLLIA
jgi:hypothetical protein